MTVEVTTRGLDSIIERLHGLPETIERAETLAVNAGVRYAHTAASRGIREQVNLPARYLGSAASGGNDRLKITKYAKPGDPEAVIRGRERPTSLARFVVGSKTLGKRTPGRPVRVKVSAKGSAKTMPGAWLMRLRAGRVLDDDTFNVGLAVRLKPGESINKREFVNTFGDYEFGENRRSPRAGRMYMLYGPSVAQVFDDVAVDIEGPVSTRVEAEFVRQFERLNK